MKVWHDDIRVPTPGYPIWVRTNQAARFVLQTLAVTEISLDHDLGLEDYDPTEQDAEFRRGADTEEDGLRLVKWMVDSIPTSIPLVVRIHSWNPAGARSMESYLKNAQRHGIVSSKVEVIRKPYEILPYVETPAERMS